MSQRTATTNTQNVQIHVNGADTAKSWPLLFSAAESSTTSLHDAPARRAGRVRRRAPARSGVRGNGRDTGVRLPVAELGEGELVRKPTPPEGPPAR
jgi:hypothetical protein